MGTRSNFLGPNRLRTESLEILASASGGKFFEDVSDYDVISEDIQNISGNYYVLGYYIGEKWDGRFHKINVEVKREGCQVYSQGGYFNPKPFSRFSEFERNLHLIDLALSDQPYFQDPIEVSLITLPCSHKEELNCVLLSKLPLNYLRGSKGQKLELINLVLDEEKKIIDSSRGEVDYSELQQEDSFQYSIMSLPPEKYDSRVALRNLTTGKGALGSTVVTIPEYQDTDIYLFSPLVLIPSQKSHFLKLSMVEDKKKKRDEISLSHIYPFLSNKYSPLIDELEQRTTRVYALLRCSVINIEKPEIALYASILSGSTEEEIPLKFFVKSSEKQGETSVYFLEIVLPELKSGKHILEFIATEKTTKSVISVANSFRVK